MDYSLSSEQQMFQKMFRDFAAKEVAKVADQADKQEGVPAKLLKRMAAQGFLGALLPDEPYGGAGLDFATFTLLLEALAAECASTALIVHVHNTWRRGRSSSTAATRQGQACCRRWPRASALARSPSPRRARAAIRPGCAPAPCVRGMRTC